MKITYMDLLVYYTRIMRFVQDKKVAHYPEFENIRQKFYDSLWRRTVKDIGGEIEDPGYGYFRITRGDAHTYVQRSRVMLDNHLSLRLSGNKPLVHGMLSKKPYPVPDYCEFHIHSLDRAAAFIRKTGKTCVVKPASGSGAGYGITTGISTFRQLKKASLWAATFSPNLLIEEEIPGDSYRLLYLGGILLDVIVRYPPVICGNGRDSIRRLIRDENESRLKGERIRALSPLVLDYECRLHLRRTGRKPNDIPEKGESVVVKQVCNQNTEQENTSIPPADEVVHPSIIRAGEEIARMFRLELLGLDVITPDIRKPLSEAGGVINEINSTPGIHHHYLIRNPEQGVPVAGKILEYILK